MVKLEALTTIHAPVERCFDLARSVEVHLQGNVHWREQALAVGGVTSGRLNLGERVTWRARHFGVWHTLTSEITAMENSAFFRDEMVGEGPFAEMKHDHHFRLLEGGKTEMRDEFWFAAPLGVLGRMAEAAVLKGYMQRLLRERNEVIRQVAESEEWRKYLQPAERGREAIG